MRTRNQLGSEETSARSNERVVASVNHQRRYVEVLQRFRAAAASVDRSNLARAALRVERTVELATREFAQTSEVAVPLRLPHHPVRRRLDVLLAGVRRRTENRQRCFRRGLTSFRIAGLTHHRCQADHAVGVLDCEHLCDHAAQRRANDVRLIDAEVIEQTNCVGRHIGKGVRQRRRWKIGEGGHHCACDVGYLAVKLGRQPAVAVVEANHKATRVGPLLA